MYQIRQKLFIPVPKTKAWDFFSDPENLKELTPKDVKISFKDTHVEKIHSGLVFTYKISPLFGIPVNWVTKIDVVEELDHFVDIQIKGPFKYWKHEHYFRSVEGGTEIQDIVNYKVPCGSIGKALHPILVKPKLEKIFEFRKRKTREFFFQND